MVLSLGKSYVPAAGLKCLHLLVLFLFLLRGQREIWRAGGEGRENAFCFDDRLLDSSEVDWCCFSTLSLCGHTGREEIHDRFPSSHPDAEHN
ncbi:hypothetical protein QQF64_012604 [Cirrhinus molitorella]|uniref:Secreted protein n=1 Tax=Cirrhinus molitorella TaxID=172907 RepID=A0ABR3LW15_9TELE